MTIYPNNSFNNQMVNPQFLNQNYQNSQFLNQGEEGDRFFALPFLTGALVGGAAIGLSRPRPIVNAAPTPVYVGQPYPSPMPYPAPMPMPMPSYNAYGSYSYGVNSPYGY